LPYCRSCGKEISEEAKVCHYCGQAVSQIKREKVVVVSPSSSVDSQIVEAIVVIVILLGGLFFATTIEAFDCPECNNSPLLRWACSYCGHDGRVTLLQLLLHSMRSMMISFTSISTSCFYLHHSLWRMYF